jgi:hypothetical protein
MSLSAISRCLECGWSIADPAASQGRCTSCGASLRAAPSSTRPPPQGLAAIHEEEYPHLREAFAAYRAKDWAQYLVQCVIAVGLERPSPIASGSQLTVIFRHRSAMIMVSVDRAEGTLAIDAPLVDIRPETEVALLRTALSMAGELGPARPARRGNKLILTLTHRLEAISPPRLVSAIGQVAEAADHLDSMLSHEFGVRMLGPILARSPVLDAEMAGTPRKLQVLRADRPVKVRPRSSSAPAFEMVTDPAVARFLDVVREAHQCSVGMAAFAPPEGTEGPIHVSFALRAAHVAGPDLSGVRVLLRHAQQVRVGVGVPAMARVLYPRLIEDRGHAPPHPVVEWPRQPANRAKPLLAATLAVVDRVKTTAHRRTLLLGGLCELILFCELAQPLLERLRALHDSSQAADSAAVDSLYQTLEGASR